MVVASEREVVRLTWNDVIEASDKLVRRWGRATGKLTGVYGVPQGGCVVAALVAPRLGVPLVGEDALGRSTLVVDDLIDTGRTMSGYRQYPNDALYRKPRSPVDVAPQAELREGWVCFPWERDASPTDAVTRLLEYIGEDPAREGLVKTPARVTRALAEMTDGYCQDALEVLSTSFDVPYDQMVVVTGIEFSSLCEHHLLPFTGEATVAYIPSGAVVGLSKLARTVNIYAHRLQVQERMTNQIAQAIDSALRPQGVGVVLRAHHSCMGCRGVRKPAAQMVTSALLGKMRDLPECRAEFLHLANAGR